MKNQKGFTLIELLIAMLVGGILLGTIYSSYLMQQRVFSAQDQVAEMQQNIRSALLLTTREVRMAGYSPEGVPGFGFENSVLPAPSALRAGRIRFTLDADGSKVLLDSTGERIELGFSPADDANGDGVPDADSDGDGVPDAVSFRRQLDTDDTAPLPGFEAVADNIQAIEFRYLDENDNPTAILANIRAVRFSILARAGNPDPKFTNSLVYCPDSNPYNSATGLCTNPAPAMIWGPYNDNFRRRLLITTIQCRNMGL